MNAAIAIRPGDVRDREFVLELGRRVSETSLSQIRPAPLVLVTNAYDRLIQYIDARVHTLLIATDGTQSVAFAIVIRDLPDEVTGTEQAFIAYMAVEPAYQRQGIASALLRAAEEVAIADGLPFISLMVTEDNAAARRLYERAGFATERRMMTKELQ